MHRPTALAVVSFGCALSVSAWADFRAEFETVKGNADDSTLSRIEVSGNHVRTDAGKVSMLFDAGSDSMIVLLHDKRQYMDLGKAMATAGAAMAQANAALANLPPEQRAMIEQQMRGTMGRLGASVDISMTATGASDRVGGYACQMYRTNVNGQHSDDTCLADVADTGVSAADRATLHRAFAQMKANMEKTTAGMIKLPLGGVPPDKFPVRTVHFDDSGQATRTAQLKSIDTGGIAAGDFAIPAGYSEQQIGGPGRRH